MSTRHELPSGSASHAPSAQIGMDAHPFALVGALAAAAIALVVLAGWLSGLDGLSTFLPNTTPMRINAAIGALLLSAAIVAQARSARGSLTLAALAALLGAITALEHLGNVNFRIDQLFVTEAAQDALHPGRMSIEAALLLVAIGTAMILSTVRSGGWLAGALVMVAALGSLFVLLRYLYGAADLFAGRGPTRLSVPASLAFLFLALAAAALGPARGWFRVIATGETAAARMARWLVPAAILIPAVASRLRLEGERLGLYSHESSAALGVAAIAVLFIVLIMVLTRILDRVEVRQRTGDEELRRTREDAERLLREVNEELERRVAQRTGELAAANEALAESNAELEAFSYSVSHDLRAPLRAIEGFGQALEEDAGASLSAGSLDHLRRIRAASTRMGELIDALLALSRISRSEIRHEEVSLSAAALEVLDRLRGQDPSRTADIHVAPGLAAPGDPRLLRVMIGNLLENAWKFTRKSDRTRIEFGSVRLDGEETFFVRDNGAGFDMAYAGKLFAPFQRLHSMAEYPGTGIGLATVRRIIQRHGGHVWAEGEPGRGASFFFTVPSEDS